MKKVLILLWGLWLPLPALSDNDWQVRGYSHYSQLQQPMFIARLEVLDDQLTAEELLGGAGHSFRLQIAVQAKRISSRGFRRLWMEGITINHEISQLQPLNSELSRLGSMLKRSLRTGDRFSVEYVAEQSSALTKIHLNDELLGEFVAPSFGPTLLRGWVGDVPLSSDFRDQLLAAGSVDADLQQAFQSLTTQPKPAEVVHRNTTQTAKKPTPASAAAVASFKPNAPLTVKIEKPQVVAATPRIEPVTIKAAAEPKPAPTKVVEPESVVSSTVPAKPALSAFDDTVAQEDTATALATSDVNSNVALPLDDEEPESTLTVEQEQALFELRQEYYQQLVKRVRNFQTIPFQAFQRRWEDDVRLQIEIDQKGQVLSLSYLKKSRFDVFNKQAADAVKRATPLPAIPSELGEETFTFSVPLTYDLRQ